jgi:nicotinamidase-related amidase
VSPTQLHRSARVLLSREHSQLLVIDVQERLAPAIQDQQRAIQNTLVLMQAGARLDVPLTVSEQYPKGLGRSVPAILERASANSIVEKVHFSCAAAPEVRARIAAQGCKQIVIAGMETHVCVLQTALGLRAAGKDVFVVQDAVSSRTLENKLAGLERMRAAGVHIVTTEMVLFEWLYRAGTPEFKELSALIK